MRDADGGDVVPGGAQTVGGDGGARALGRRRQRAHQTRRRHHARALHRHAAITVHYTCQNTVGKLVPSAPGYRVEPGDAGKQGTAKRQKIFRYL